MRLVRTVAVIALVLGATGCWMSPGFDAGRTNYAAGETTLTAATVAGVHELWSTRIAPEDSAGPRVHPPLALGGEIYAVSVDAHAAALDAATGVPRWTTRLPDFGFGPYPTLPPALVGGTIYVPSNYVQVNAGGVVAVDRETGAATGGGAPRINVYGVAEFEGRLVSHVAQFIPSPSPSGAAYVDFGPFNAVGSTGLGGRILPDFAVVGGGVAWADSGTSAIGFLPGCPPAVPGSEFCAPSWTTNLGSVPGGPAALGDGAAVYSHGTSVSVLDMATGAVLWRADLGSGASRAATTPTAIYVATADGRLVALPAGGCGAPVCAPLWEAPVGGAPAGGVVVGGDVAYVPTATGVVAFAAAGCGAATCASLTSVATSSPVSGLIVHDGRLIVGTEGGDLTAFGL